MFPWRIAPFTYSDGTYALRGARVTSQCVNGGSLGTAGIDGGLGEAVWAAYIADAYVAMDERRAVNSLVRLSQAVGARSC